MFFQRGIVKNINKTPEPLIVPGCELWQDYSDYKSLSLSGSQIYNCRDKSGNGNYSNQSSGPNRPLLVENSINGNSVALFDGIDDYMNTTVSGIDWDTIDFTVFAVARLSNVAIANSVGIIGNRMSGVSGWWTLGYNPGLAIIETEIGPDTVEHLSSGFNAKGTGVQIYSWDKLNRDASIYHNNDLKSTIDITGKNIGNTTNTILQIGRWWQGGQYWPGEIGELIIYLRQLTTAERLYIYTYLSNKWGR